MFLEQHNGSVELMTEGGRRNGPVVIQLCWILSWHSKDNRFFSTRGNTCRQGTDVATSSMPWTSMCQGLGSVYCPLRVCVCELTSVVSTLCDPMDCCPRLSWGFSENTEVGGHASSRVSSPPRDHTYISCSPCIAGGSLLLSHWGSPYCPLSVLNSISKVCLSS